MLAGKLSGQFEDHKSAIHFSDFVRPLCVGSVSSTGVGTVDDHCQWVVGRCPPYCGLTPHIGPTVAMAELLVFNSPESVKAAGMCRRAGTLTVA